MAYIPSNSSFNLSGERRRASYSMERSLDERHPQEPLLLDHHKKERSPLYVFNVSWHGIEFSKRIIARDRCKSVVNYMRYFASIIDPTSRIIVTSFTVINNILRTVHNYFIFTYFLCILKKH